MWDGLAFRQAIRPGSTITAVNGARYSPDALRNALSATRTGRAPIRLTVRDRDQEREVQFDYRGGMRFPHLERVGRAPTALDRALQPRTQ